MQKKLYPNKNILLSIIIPCYNGGSYILEMIDCFRNQTVDFWELIIVDDGSTDGSADTISNYIAKDKNIYLYKRERLPKGGDTCRNIGFEKAVGKYISFLDCDDLVSATFVEHRVLFMEENPQIDYSTFIAKCFTNDSALPSYNDPGRNWGDGSYGKDLLSEILKGYDYPFSVWNNIYRRDSLEDIRWDEKIYVYQDFDYMLTCVLKGLKHKYSKSKEVDYFYRQFYSSESVCSSFSKPLKVQSTLYLFEKVMKNLQDKDLFSRYKNSFFDFILLHEERLISEGFTGDKLDTYIKVICKFYDCKYRMLLLQNVSTIRNYYLRGVLFRLICILCFGNLRHVRNFLSHLPVTWK